MIEKFSLLVELSQHIKQLRMDRNSKAFSLEEEVEVNLEVLTLPVVAEPTLRATMYVGFNSHLLRNVTALKNDFVLQTCGFS